MPNENYLHYCIAKEPDLPQEKGEFVIAGTLFWYPAALAVISALKRASNMLHLINLVLDITARGADDDDIPLLFANQGTRNR